MSTNTSIQPLAIEGYAKDESSVKRGAHVSLGKNPDGSLRTIIVRPINSAAYEDRLEARRKQYSRATLQSDPEIDKTLQKDTLAESIVFVGFENFYPPGSFEPDGNGGHRVREGVEPYPNTYDVRRAMLEDRDFFVDFLTAAATPETFRARSMDDDLGNSQQSSNGS